jgi:uncharacterized protein (TIGR00251 family)
MPPAQVPLPAWARLSTDAQCVVLALHVQPNARKSEIVGRHGMALKVRIAAPANENRANAALIEFLHAALAVPKSALRIVHGKAARQKTIEVAWDLRHTLNRIQRLDALTS